MSEHNDEFAAIRKALADYTAQPDKDQWAFLTLTEACDPTTIASLLAARDRAKDLAREVEYLRRFGNKDCTAMADAAMQEDAAIDRAQGTAT